jgi:hypothetical protein
MKVIWIDLACRTHGNDETAHKILVRKPQGKNLLGRNKWKDWINQARA